MKKLLLGTAAVGLVFAAAPAHAEVDLDIGGYFKGYLVGVDQDDGPATTDEESNDFDIIRDTELHISGETTLDNGLTVGAHFEIDVDDGDSSAVNESYAYFSGAWGRVNFGSEDGAAYLLQVAAPSADSNVDGVRQYVQPFNYDALTADTFNAAGTALVSAAGGLDYDQDITGKSDKITYMTPVFSGFQVGLTYSPDNDSADDLEGVGLDDVADAFGTGYEIAARYEGELDAVGFTIGAGYSHVELEQVAVTTAGDPTDDRTAWNVGLDLDVGPFGVGVVYMEDDQGELDVDGAAGGFQMDDSETLVVGVDYTTGPFKLGASYLNQDVLPGTVLGGRNGIESDRYTGGVVYTYGPGMTFRGSVSYVEHDATGIGGAGSNEVDATAVMLGTQVKF